MGNKKRKRRESAAQGQAPEQDSTPKPRKKPPRLQPDKLRARG